MDDRTELTEAEREGLHAPYICDCDEADTCRRMAGTYADVQAIVAARVSALSRDLAAQNTRIAAVEAVLAEHWDWKAGRSLHAAVTRALSVSDPGQDKESRACPCGHDWWLHDTENGCTCGCTSVGVRRG